MFGSLSILLLFAQIRLAPADPALDLLVEEALRKAPEAAIARTTTEAARFRIEPARTPPDPMFSISYQNDGRALSLGEAEGSFAGLMVSQEIPWPGKLSLAARAAESEAHSIEIQSVTRAERSIEARLRVAWYELALARAVDALIDDRRNAATKIESSVRARYEAGLSEQQDVLRAQVELVRIDEMKAMQKASIAARSAEVNRILSRPQITPIDGSPALPIESDLPPASSIIPSVLDHSPEVRAARQELETGRINVLRARRNFLPDFVVSAGSMYRGAFEMGPMWQASVSVTVPAWIDRRQRNELAEAQAEVSVSTSEIDRLTSELELMTRDRLAQLAAATEVAALYQNKIIPLDELSLESALASYQTGRLPFVAVLESLNVLYADRASLLERVAAIVRLRIAVDEGAL